MSSHIIAETTRCFEGTLSLLSFRHSLRGSDKSHPESASACLPLLKWPGGKRELLPHTTRLLPLNSRRYFEPFVGGGAVFFATRPRDAFLSDTDSELINCYIQVRDRPELVIARLASLRNTEEDYYKVRRSIPRTDVGRAARTIYLATLAFNGIHRKNTEGQFNVPYGYKWHLRPCDRPRIRAASHALQRTQLRCGDFEIAVEDAGKRDVVYLDPPYTVAHGNNGFLKYNAKIFSGEMGRGHTFGV